LEEARRALEEAVVLPARHPALFAKLPLRPRSGVLLYGPPGCGKTHLAHALARATGLRIITVKGPELLDKFIGASEAAVRRVFDTAAAAAPSVLFLDEFDSLAPRRGADSTGVTDRVVNQLLCQLDGIEVLSGVAVLAASTRPDLIDPALLRPGRLDRRVLCGLPHLHARASILKRALRGLTLAADVNLEILAEKSEGLTGADLQAVAYNAQLELLRDRQDSHGLSLQIGGQGGRTSEGGSSGFASGEDSDENESDGDGVACAPPPWASPSHMRQASSRPLNDLSDARMSPVEAAHAPRRITQAHMLAALCATQPSLQPRELALYERIYSQLAA